MDCRVDFDMKGLEKMVKALDKMGKSPQKAVTKAASKAFTPVKREIRRLTPVGDTQYLRKSIIRKAEKSGVIGKKVYEATFDPALNDVLQKPIKHPGAAGGKYPKAYYPASQEYGFITRSKGGGYSYVPGLHFMREGADNTEVQAKAIMVDTLEKELDKLWKEANHK